MLSSNRAIYIYIYYTNTLHLILYQWLEFQILYCLCTRMSYWFMRDMILNNIRDILNIFTNGVLADVLSMWSRLWFCMLFWCYLLLFHQSCWTIVNIDNSCWGVMYVIERNGLSQMQTLCRYSYCVISVQYYVF